MFNPSDITCLGNKVLVLPQKRQEQTQAGIIIPVVVNKEIDSGVVVNVADQVLHVKVGDTVMYPAGAGVGITIENTNYRFLNGPVIDAQGDLIAII